MTGWSGEEGLIRGQQNQVRTKVRVILSLVSINAITGFTRKSSISTRKEKRLKEKEILKMRREAGE